MNQGKYIFAQRTDFLPRRVFDRIIEKYEGNKYVRSFTCWNQLLCMVFGQLTSRDSMRDLMLSLEAHQPKYYHLGFGYRVTRRNLGKANERRNYKIVKEFAYILIEEARKSCYKNDFEVEVEGNVYALDSTLNAVKIQIFCAVIAYCLVALVGNKLKVNCTIYEILQILSISLLDKTPIREILTKCDYNNFKELKNK